MVQRETKNIPSLLAKIKIIAPFEKRESIKQLKSSDMCVKYLPMASYEFNIPFLNNAIAQFSAIKTT